MFVPKVKVSARAGAMLGIVGMSAIAGILVTAMATPALAVAGMTANNSIGLFENLPSYIKPELPSQKSSIYATNADGSPVLLASLFDQDRESVGWDQVSQFAKDAAIAVEDPRFYEHGGVDLKSTFRALLGNFASGGISSGASTIPMQYIRNIFTQRAEAIQNEEERDKAYAEAIKQSPDRKLKEMKLAIGLEKEYTKDEILLGYLNIANFGARVYGIQSAAHYYFNVSAKDLTLAQAASLIAMVNAPEALRIDIPENIADNEARRNQDVLGAMLKAKTITQAQYDEAIATPVTPVIIPSSTGCQTAISGAGFLCDYVTLVFKHDPTFGDTPEARERALKTGGYKIYTTLDLDLQQKAYDTLNEYVPHSYPNINLGGSVVSVQPGTGRVLAMVQNKDYNADPTADPTVNSSVNYSTDFDYGGSTGFQVGSTYKVFVLEDWLKSGYSLGQMVNGSSRPFNMATFKDSCPGASWGGMWTSRNDSGGNPGSVSVLNALTSSINNAFISMAQKLDQCSIRSAAEALGVHRADGKPLGTNPSAVLGTNEIAPLTMAAAFAGIANKGVYCTPIAIDSMTDASGAPVTVPQSTCNQSVAPNIAATMAYAMKTVVTGGTATLSSPGDGIQLIGKTGTTDSEIHTWMVGSSTKVATAVWVGNVEGFVSIRNSRINGVAGGDIRHHIFRNYMRLANEKYGGDSFPPPDDKLLSAPSVGIPNLVGSTMSNAESTLTNLGFTFVDGGPMDSDRPAGQVAGTDPPAGASITMGSTVTVYSSNGSLTALPNVVGQKITDATLALTGWNVKQVLKLDLTCVPDTVLSQDPAAGLAKKAEITVTLVVCKKP